MEAFQRGKNSLNLFDGALIFGLKAPTVEVSIIWCRLISRHRNWTCNNEAELQNLKTLFSIGALRNSVVNFTICDCLGHIFLVLASGSRNMACWIGDRASWRPGCLPGGREVIKRKVNGSLASLASLDFLHMDPPMETCSIFLKRFTICRDHVGLRGLSSLMILCGSRGWVICSLQRGGEALGLDLRSTDSDGQWISRGVGD